MYVFLHIAFVRSRDFNNQLGKRSSLIWKKSSYQTLGGDTRSGFSLAIRYLIPLRLPFTFANKAPFTLYRFHTKTVRKCCPMETA